MKFEKVFLSLGLCCAGLFGMMHNVPYMGWVIFVSLLVALNA
jgi:hypothetical protein